ncbi:hypothetical protein TRVL_10381 [Trypanosoma vivax]|nr:hypothetical protein TRVL_10381 [Trypanosoma vivax]
MSQHHASLNRVAHQPALQCARAALATCSPAGTMHSAPTQSASSVAVSALLRRASSLSDVGLVHSTAKAKTKQSSQVAWPTVSAMGLFVTDSVLLSTRTTSATRATAHSAPPSTGATLLSITLARADSYSVAPGLKQIVTHSVLHFRNAGPSLVRTAHHQLPRHWYLRHVASH